MKLRNTLLPLFLLLGTFTFATVGDQLKTAQVQLQAVLDARPAILAKFASLTQKEDDIKFSVAAFNKQSAALEAADQALTMDSAQVASQLEAHNANQCTEYNHDGSCSAYNAEAERLNAARDAIQQRAENEQQTAAKLEELRGVITEQTEKWAADLKATRAEGEANVTEVTRLQTLIEQLRQQLSACQKSLNGNLERMHDICGAPFDGNVVPQ